MSTEATNGDAKKKDKRVFLKADGYIKLVPLLELERKRQTKRTMPEFVEEAMVKLKCVMRNGHVKKVCKILNLSYKDIFSRVLYDSASDKPQDTPLTKQERNGRPSRREYRELAQDVRAVYDALGMPVPTRLQEAATLGRTRVPVPPTPAPAPAQMPTTPPRVPPMPLPLSLFGNR